MCHLVIIVFIVAEVLRINDFDLVFTNFLSVCASRESLWCNSGISMTVNLIDNCNNADTAIKLLKYKLHLFVSKKEVIYIGMFLET